MIHRHNIGGRWGYGLTLCAILPRGNYLPHTLGPDRYAKGMGLILLAALCWASCAALTHFRSSQVMLTVSAAIPVAIR